MSEEKNELSAGTEETSEEAEEMRAGGRGMYKTASVFKFPVGGIGDIFFLTTYTLIYTMMCWILSFIYIV
jgi:hypothetical protein